MGRTKIVFISLILALFPGSIILAQTPGVDEIYSENGPFMGPRVPDPGIPDTVTVESKTIPSGATSFTLNVYLYNDEELGGFNLPITWDSPDITCDSVSFVGSRIDYVNTKLFSIDNVNQRLQAGMIIFFEPVLEPGNGKVYTAYFKIAPGAADQVINIDSTFFPPGGDFALTLASGFNIVPQFVPGVVTIGTPANPEIAVDPAALSFAGVEGGGNPPAQTLNISNSGTGTLEWSLSKSHNWLGLDPMSGVDAGAVDVSVNLTGLSAGTYHDTIVVSANADNSPQKVPVLLAIEPPPPMIHLDPTSIELNAIEGSTPPAEQIYITNTGGGTLNWSATSQTGWLSIHPASGIGNGTITLDFDLTGLAPGVYYDTVTVSDENAGNSPQITIVVLNVEPEAEPEIVVSPSELFFYATDGGSNPPPQTFTITNIGGGQINWTLSETESWLEVNPLTGTGDATITVTVDITGLGQGTYSGVITISVTGGANIPLAVEVHLTISDFVYGTAVIIPEVQHFIRAYAIPPKSDTIYIGNFGNTYDITGIDQSTVLVNGVIPPMSWTIVPSYPGFNGPVLEIVIAARPFILGYDYPADPMVHPFLVTGQFIGQIAFEASGEVTLYSFTVGDANRDGVIDIGDPVFLIDYIFRNGPAPDPIFVGDANGDGRVDIGDVRYLIKYIFQEGPGPVVR